jgi:hypothetical protein
VTTATPVHAVRIGPEGLPEHTLGWSAMDWASTYLLQPDGSRAGQTWTFTEEQMRFVAWWYAIDRSGKFLKTRGVLRRAKGWGKDPLAAVLAMIEFVGPCRFGGWDGAEPIVIPQPAAWVDVAAVAKEQTRNTMLCFPGLISKQAILEYHLDLGKEIIYADHGRSQIQAVTSSPKTVEGHRCTFGIEGETQHWVQNNDGLEMDKALRRNVAKVNGRTLAITNAHRIGEGSVAELDWEQWIEQGAKGSLLYDSVEAPADTDLEDDESLRAGLMAAYGDAYWAPIDRLMIDARDTRDTESYRRRYYLNQIRSERASWISADEWNDAEADYEPNEGEWITLGFDGSRHRDSTALVGTVVESGYQWVLGVWSRPPDVDEWEVPADEVDRCVEAAFSKYRVWRMLCDTYWWEQSVSMWAGRFGKDTVLEMKANSQYLKVALAVKSYETAIRGHEMSHERNPYFTEHILNAVKYPIGSKDEDGEPLYMVNKENPNSMHKVDIATAAIYSFEARNEAVASGLVASYGWTVR